MTNRLPTEGTDYLLSAGQAVGVRRFVAQSHIVSYARMGTAIKSEEEPLDPTPAPEMREPPAAIRRLEEAVLGATWREGIVLRYGHFYGPGTSMASRRLQCQGQARAGVAPGPPELAAGSAAA